jgi:hypothetical protein
VRLGLVAAVSAAVEAPQLALLEDPTPPPVVRVHLVGTVRRASVCSQPDGAPELVVVLEPAGGGDEIVARLPGALEVLASLATRMPSGAAAVLIGGGLRSFRRTLDDARVVQLLHCEHAAPVTP